MKHKFKAKIYKVGINLCVKVPAEITSKMKPSKGYIYIKGKINNAPFMQTLVPVKNANYRLFVNGLMLKATGLSKGDDAVFVIEQVSPQKMPMNPALLKRLQEEGLGGAFEQLTASRQKDILRYLNNLKTESTLNKNVEKVIGQLRKKENRVSIP